MHGVLSSIWASKLVALVLFGPRLFASNLGLVEYDNLVVIITLAFSFILLVEAIHFVKNFAGLSNRTRCSVCKLNGGVAGMD
ncbi:hypothetical protein VNO77_00379 [Canavalia gladiata]|uniref:Uncharacterized protein n=1 Tax=Canavalia gladiata TaxID=3824 RepID=A0AAN9MR13_CANGL